MTEFTDEYGNHAFWVNAWAGKTIRLYSERYGLIVDYDTAREYALEILRIVGEPETEESNWEKLQKLPVGSVVRFDYLSREGQAWEAYPWVRCVGGILYTGTIPGGQVWANEENVNARNFRIEYNPEDA